MSVQIQEITLIEDLLYTMMSIEGNFIKRKLDSSKGKYIYAIEPYLEASTCGK